MGERSRLNREDYTALRQKFDRNDPIMHGMGVSAIRQVMHRKHQTPEWFSNNDKVAEFVSLRFPWANKFDHKCRCDRCMFPEHGSVKKCDCRPCRETMMAGKWLIVIRLWFLAHTNDSEIETEYQWKPGTVGSIVQKIRRAIAGERLDGKPRTGKPRGRPKVSSYQELSAVA